MALGLVLVPLAVEIQRAALAVGQFAAHLLVTHWTIREVLHILFSDTREEVKGSIRLKNHQEIENLGGFS